MTEMEFFTADHGGERVLYVLPVIPDTAPDEVREGLARRRISVMTGRCPCGASAPMPSRAERRAAARRRQPLSVAIEHEPGCPASDDLIVFAIRRWGR